MQRSVPVMNKASDIFYINNKGKSLSINSLDFTVKAVNEMRDLISEKDFSNRDSALIFQYLTNHLEYIPFGMYLRRYMYYRMGITKDFFSVRTSDFRSYLLDCFHETHTPKAFHETSTTISVLIEGWLNAATVSRENVFLLGFALKMPVEDVSTFLTKATFDTDFNFNIPEEVIYWHCYRNNLSARYAIKLIDKYYNECNLHPVSSAPDRIDPSNGLDLTLAANERSLIGERDEDILNYLFDKNRRRHYYRYSLTGYHQFCVLIEEAKMEIAKLRASQADFTMLDKEIKKSRKAIREADIEKELYCAVPVNEKGNKKRISLSKLGKSFAEHRLTRQRMSRLINKKARITRFDLITLLFLITSLQEADVDPSQRYDDFVKKTESILSKCFMGPLNLSNLYETYVLTCTLTDDPLVTFSDVWDLAYSE